MVSMTSVQLVCEFILKTLFVLECLGKVSAACRGRESRHGLFVLIRERLDDLPKS